MRILMYSDHFGGPTTTFLIGDLKGLSEKHEVVYACIGKTEGRFSHSDVRVLPYYVNPLTKKFRWICEKNGWSLNFKCRGFKIALEKLLEEFKPDLIQFNFAYEALRVTDNLAEKYKGIPMVMNFLGYDASFHLQRPSYVNKLKQLSAFPNLIATCNTSFLRANLESKGIYFKRNEIIYTGVDTLFFERERQPKSSEFIFLQIATLAKRKGQEVTLRAFRKFLSQVEDPSHYRLILAGGAEDSYGEELRKLPGELGITAQVTLIDWITREQARELMNDASCFLHHSRTIAGRTEGIPTAISEAMSMELPVISTQHAGIPELVEDGVNGFLLQENDVENYAKRMKEITQWGLQPNNRKKVEEKFNIRNRIKAFEELYTSLV